MVTPVNDHAALAAGHYGDLLGHPAAARRFHRRGAYHPPQPYTTNAAFRDLWNHAAVARRNDADAPAVTAALPGRYGVFFLAW